MKLEPIIQSLLDTDFYKFNMNQVIFHKHTDAMGEYIFKCRNPHIVFSDEMVKEINENHVKEEEVLSDCAYYYDHKEKSFYM